MNHWCVSLLHTAGAPEQRLRLAMLLDLGGAGQNMNSLGGRLATGRLATEGSGRFGRATNLPWDDEDYHNMGRHVHICRNRG